MSYLLDTCVISELMRRAPEAAVTHWIREQLDSDLYLSVMTIAELKKGVDRLAASQRKERLETWLSNDLLVRFKTRLLSIDLQVALTWGMLAARLESSGHKMPAFDALIAATALKHNLTLVTRNVADFAHSGVTIVNPWN